MVPVSVQISNGNTSNADYTQTPNYSPAIILQGQIQSLTFSDLRQLEGLNIQGSKRAVYLQGDIEGLVRETNKGGDILTFPDSTIWLVTTVLEDWNPPDANISGWCKVAVTEQMS
jgi:hypothetical protein